MALIAAMMMLESFWWWQCNDRDIISRFPASQYPPSPPHPNKPCGLCEHETPCLVTYHLGVLTWGEGGEVWVFVPVQYVWRRSVALTSTRLQRWGGHRAEEQRRCALRLHPQLCRRLRLEVHFLWQVATAVLVSVSVCVPPTAPTALSSTSSGSPRPLTGSNGCFSVCVCVCPSDCTHSFVVDFVWKSTSFDR